MELVYITKKSLSRRWLVIYTRPRWEKKVSQLLETQGIISYCPVRKVENQWADRKKIVEIPLFASYVFTKVNAHEESKVRQTLGVINFIYYQGKPAEVQDKVIEDIRHFLHICPDMEVVSLNNLSVGDKVRIKNGAFNNHEGEIIEIQGKHVLMMLDNLGCYLVARVPVNNIIIA
jgi:transcriptional antiterminator RfaH